MDNYDICINYTEIVAGTSNRLNPVYVEAAKNISENTTKGLAYLKNFITSIENIANKDNVKDERISKTKGNIKSFKSHDDVKFAIEFLSKNLKEVSTVRELNTIYNELVKCQPQYTEAYQKNIRLAILEYENALYLLVTGLAMMMSTQIEVVQNGYQIKIQKKFLSTLGTTGKTITQMAKQLSAKDHDKYLQAIIDAKDDVGVNTTIKESVTFMESSVTDTLALIGVLWDNTKYIGRTIKNVTTAVKNSIFGVVPLIRSVLYLRYKKKADTIVALEQQVDFINKNIEQLNNIKDMDPAKKAEVIKKQKAYVEAYRKKAEKLRAQLIEGEKEAATAIKQEDPEMKKTDDNDGDFVLEGVSVESLFTEASNRSISDRRNKEMIKIIKDPNKIRQRVNKRNSKIGLKQKSLELSAVDKKETAIKEKVFIDKSTLKSITDEFHKATVKPTIRLTPKPVAKDNNITASKFAGRGYWPKDKDYPRYKNNDMYMLAQLNFDELPHIPGFPTKGILQFFVVDNEFFISKDLFSPSMVVYHEKIDMNNIDDTERPNFTSIEYSPIPKVFYLTGEIKEMHPCDIYSYKFDNAFLPIFNKHFEVHASKISDINKLFTSDSKDPLQDIWEELVHNPENESWGCRIGGYPNFTQADPRDYNKKLENLDELLLQIDSENGILWGDCGIANMFINKNKLDKLNFKEVFFTWDCC